MRDTCPEITDDQSQQVTGCPEITEDGHLGQPGGRGRESWALSLEGQLVKTGRACGGNVSDRGNNLSKGVETWERKEHLVTSGGCVCLEG